MSSMESGSEIVRTSKAGYVLTSRKRRDQLLEEFDKSGLSAPKFAALTGIKYQTFMGWLSRRKQNQTDSAMAPLPSEKNSGLWIETVIDKARSASSESTGALLVRFPSGAVIELANAPQALLAAALLRAWEKAPC